MSTFFHSIRWRIQAWHGLILLVAIGAFCFTAYHFAWEHQYRRIDRELQTTERQLIRSIMQAAERVDANDRTDKTSEKNDAKPGDKTDQRGHDGSPPPPPMSPQEIAARLRAGEITLPAGVSALFESNAYFSLRDKDGRILLQSNNAPANLVLLPVPAEGFSEEIRALDNRRENLRSSAQGFSSLVGRDITQELTEMHRFALALAASGLGLWALGLIGGWWLAGRAIKPIATISRTASRIAEGNLNERIDTTDNDSELDQLSRVLNQTFERMHAAFERQKQFTADASHELRTPVTILLSETQRILKRERSPEEYRDVVRTCHDTAERMRHLIEALLMLARQEAAGGELPRESCDLSDVLSETIAHLRPLAVARGIHVEANLKPALCRGDRAALSILAANLVGNAIAHQGPSVNTGINYAQTGGGIIHIASGTDDGRVFFIVSDNGPGIQAEDLPHIFERFYRADKARTSSSGHTGLGLAIARMIAENHGGTIEARSTYGQGATFTVKLPLV